MTRSRMYLARNGVIGRPLCRPRHHRSRPPTTHGLRVAASFNPFYVCLFFCFQTFRSVCFIRSLRITTEYQIQDFDVFSIGLETRCPLGAKPSVEIQHLRTCNDDGPKRPVETQRLFIGEIATGAETKEREAPP